MRGVGEGRALLVLRRAAEDAAGERLGEAALAGRRARAREEKARGDLARAGALVAAASRPPPAELATGWGLSLGAAHLARLRGAAEALRAEQAALDRSCTAAEKAARLAGEEAAAARRARELLEERLAVAARDRQARLERAEDEPP